MHKPKYVNNRPTENDLDHRILHNVSVGQLVSCNICQCNCIGLLYVYFKEILITVPKHSAPSAYSSNFAHTGASFRGFIKKCLDGKCQSNLTYKAYSAVLLVCKLVINRLYAIVQASRLLWAEVGGRDKYYLQIFILAGIFHS